MQATFRRAITLFMGLTLVAVGLAAQGAPPVQGQAPGTAGGRGATNGRGATGFPAQQRPAADAAVVDRGKQLYGIHCRACHGPDLRGGDMGGPNLLRSDVMLNDQNGELLQPVLRGSRASGGMNAIDLPEADAAAVAVYIHSVLATARPQGAPPAGLVRELDIVVGNAAEGQTYFAAKCGSCHSATGDLKGLGTRVSNATQLQNLWVAGGRGGRGGGRGDAADTPAGRSTTTAIVSPSNGPRVEGSLERIDDFSITLLLADGTRRSFRRMGDVPRIEIVDPLAAHKALLQTYSDRDMHNVTAYLVTLK